MKFMLVVKLIYKHGVCVESIIPTDLEFLFLLRTKAVFGLLEV